MSFQLYSDRPLLRWDNALHYPDIANFPHHFHDEDENVFPSNLTGSLLNDFDVVMAEIKIYMKM